MMLWYASFPVNSKLLGFTLSVASVAFAEDPGPLPLRAALAKAAHTAGPFEANGSEDKPRHSVACISLVEVPAVKLIGRIPNTQGKSGTGRD
jgi:hypothetical protein